MHKFCLPSLQTFWAKLSLLLRKKVTKAARNRLRRFHPASVDWLSTCTTVNSAIEPWYIFPWPSRANSKLESTKACHSSMIEHSNGYYMTPKVVLVLHQHQGKEKFFFAPLCDPNRPDFRGKSTPCKTISSPFRLFNISPVILSMSYHVSIPTDRQPCHQCFKANYRLFAACNRAYS